jgi:hypothetical protein
MLGLVNSMPTLEGIIPQGEIAKQERKWRADLSKSSK